MDETLLERLKRKLAEADGEAWERAKSREITLDPETRLDLANGTLSGGLSFRVMDGKGVWHLVHHEAMDAVRDTVELDGFLARGFSTFLMKHPTWPK